MYAKGGRHGVVGEAVAGPCCSVKQREKTRQDRGGSQTNQRTESPPDAKPLMFEYVGWDRHGRAVVGLRGPHEAWLQGFVCVTQFTLVSLLSLDGVLPPRPSR